jgi:penicillin amidase
VNGFTASKSDRYLAGHEWRKLAIRRELIRIRGGKLIERDVRISRHGPIISDFTSTEAASEVLALRWCATEASQESLSIYSVNQARNWQSF